MPHEHINSSLAPRLPDGRAPERVVVSWTKPSHVIPGRDGRPEPGSVQLSSEWLISTARFASPAIVTIDLDAPHEFMRNDLAEDSDSAKLCKWCTEPLDAVLPSGESRHHPGTGDAASELFVGPDLRPTSSGIGTGDPAISHVYTPIAGPDPDPDMDPCKFCDLGKHDSRAAHVPALEPHEWSLADSPDNGHRIIYTEGAPTWSEPCTGFNVSLTREDINYLIIRLRRARDEAFGIDA